MSVRIALIAIFGMLTLLVNGQNGNPFELLPRLEEEVVENLDSVSDQEVGPQNPFDIVPPKTLDQRVEPNPNPYEEISPEVDIALTKESRFYSILTLLIFVILTIITIFFRNYYNRVYNAFINENLLSQLHREREAGNFIPFWVLYVFFILNGGVFIIQFGKVFDYALPEVSNYNLLFRAIGLMFLIVVCRHLLFWVISNIFPVSKEMKLYSFTVNVFNIIVGLLLIPINLLLFYTGPEIGKIIAVATVVVVASIYLFRSFRGVLIANKYVQQYLFHFLLYICTVELVPLVVLLKLIYGRF